MLQDLGAERAVLSGLCQHGQDAYVDVDDLITEVSFTDEENQLLFKCLTQILEDGGKIDPSSIVTCAQFLGVVDRLFKTKQDHEYVRSIFNFPIKRENVRNFATIIAKLEFARDAQVKVKAAYEKLGSVTGRESIDEIISIPEEASFELMGEANRNKNDTPSPVSENIVETIEEIAENPVENVGIPTPWQCYNEAIGGGIRKGGVNLIGARPKVGKTTWAKELGIHVSETLEIPVLMLDTEMVKSDQAFRALASLSGVCHNRIETGQFAFDPQEKAAVFEAARLLQENKLFFHHSVAGKPFHEILSIIRRWIIREVGYDDEGSLNDCLVIYDYFKIMDSSGISESMKEYQVMGFQISELTDFAKIYDFGCAAFVQLNRQEDISQSDRLRWLCHSYSTFKRKSDDEIAMDGVGNGNRKMTIEDARFGGGAEYEGYISFDLKGDIAKLEEIGDKEVIEARKQLNQQGFNSDDDLEDVENESIPFDVDDEGDDEVQPQSD